MVRPITTMQVRTDLLFKLKAIQDDVRQHMTKTSNFTRVSYNDLIEYMLTRIDPKEVADAVIQKTKK